ncbi:fimbrial protein [Silvimonas sp.]|uniref:fimbrial protein n=1 Tax=Silvimonas sp. TaxID=2650811 RepID=UPI002850371B|nr:fimbrial protein [Silvimonas sp.]MDR3426676.1 fimbrial protein [Silvimonas sp.]
MKRFKKGSTFAMTRQLRTMFQLLFALCMALIASQSWAGSTCIGGGDTITVNMPASIAVPRDAPTGTSLTPWAESVATSNYFTCTVDSSSYTGAHIGLGSTLVSSGQTYVDSGVTYTIYKTSVAGVGIIIGGIPYDNGCGWRTGWGMGYSGYCNQNGTVYNGGKYHFMLVKTGPIIGGTVNSAVMGVLASYDNSTYPSMGTTPVNFVNTPVIVTVLSCVTPDVTVDLKTHKASELTGPGTYTNATSFQIALNSCPAGMNTVSYQIDPTTTVIDASNAVVALDTASATPATGVGVQILDGAGNPIQLSTRLAMPDYSTGTGGSYSIPLQARYYQTGTTVGAGEGNTSLTFTMTYL